MKSPVRILPILIILFSCGDAGTQKTASAGNLTLFASGLSHPVCITNAGDCRLFVVNQAGYIHILDTLGNVLPMPFLDIHEQVTYGGERGLLGLTFHPQYSSNGYFYVNYTGAGDSTHISRFSVSTGNPDLADPLSEFKLMTIFQPYSNHNGGDLAFGPDGFLYIGLGDGGSGGDPGNRAQNPMEYLGKMLRIDISQGNPYAIPPSNPFYNTPGTLGEIWALGLRNPWRFSFDRVTGDLWIADVGQNAVEEINFQPASSAGGENYGWRCYEGNNLYNGSGCSPVSTYTFPVYTYPHGEECSVTGGFVYRGDSTSSYYGSYFFADYCSDRIWILHDVAGNWVKEDFGRFTGNNFSAFGEDSSGRLYVAGLTSGKIWRLVLDVPLSLSVADTIVNGQAKCYDAINTINAGGSSTPFVILEGGSSTMIAGGNIIYSINTVVWQGGYLHGSIATGNQFCNTRSPSVVLCDFGAYAGAKGDSKSTMKVYPNPTTGTFTIEYKADPANGLFNAEAFGMFGSRAILKELPCDGNYKFTLSGNQPGIYFVKIITDGAIETFKVLLLLQ